MAADWKIDFPTLGDLADAWVQAHCVVPDSHQRGAPFVWSDWQFWCAANFYRIRDDATFDPNNPPRNQAFTYRRAQVIGSQKALALDTPVITTNGWSTMGDLRVGDRVFDMNGEPTEVLAKSRIFHDDTYRVTFSDGAELVACGDHEWIVVERAERLATRDLSSGLTAPGVPIIKVKPRRIVSIEPINPVPTQCITVASETHSFLAGREMIPTGNSGKGPWAATLTCVEAVGPSQFAGWAEDGDVYACEDNGCGCGFVYAYQPGEPKGTRHPSPLIQLTATSEDQVDNTYRPLANMVRIGPLSELMAVREGFIRILNRGGGMDMDRIDAVTAAANSRLGNPISFALQDETGLWVKSNGMVKVAETQRRGAAGMGGRTLETTNAFDPAQDSVAQRTYESSATDVFRFHDPPPANLSYRNKRERRKIHQHNYRYSPWVPIDSIDAEAAELMEKDPAQAERFFGNRIVADYDSYFDAEAWARVAVPVEVPDGATIALGFDGSQYDDWTSIRARWFDGDALYGFTPRFADDRPTCWNPSDFGGEIPRGEVQAAVEELFDRYNVVRFYLDPPFWQSEIDAWAARFGEKVVVQWPTYRVRQMAGALERMRTDITAGKFTHDGDQTVLNHIRNARRVRRSGGVIIGKPNDHQKIDLVMADALAHEAACDARAKGLTRRVQRRVLIY